MMGAHPCRCCLGGETKQDVRQRINEKKWTATVHVKFTGNVLLLTFASFTRIFSPNANRIVTRSSAAVVVAMTMPTTLVKSVR